MDILYYNENLEYNEGRPKQICRKIIRLDFSEIILAEPSK